MDGVVNRLPVEIRRATTSRVRAHRVSRPPETAPANPLVSVVLPTYNGAGRGYLAEAIASVLAQTYPHRELIIVDDGSADDTPALLANYAQPGVRIVHQLNQGLAAARNTGIHHATGEYICFLDDDDRWLPEKLERQVRFFGECERRSGGRVKLVFTPITLIDERGRAVGRQAHTARGDIYESLFTTNLVDSPSSVMIKRDVLDAVGSFDPALRSIEDLDLWIRIAQDYEIHSMDEPLVEYRVHTNKLSTQLATMYMYRRRVVERALDANRRTDLHLDRGAVLFDIEKQYFDKYLQMGDADGALRHFRRAWLCCRREMIAHPKMPIKMLLVKLGFAGLFVPEPPAAAITEALRT
ncbi:MAG TPA: glycosyltransferase family A protein [Acidobacteriota bacterium]|nr:glycosyltransferase family A protein [Acidobacteriota bacterium]